MFGEKMVIFFVAAVAKLIAICMIVFDCPALPPPTFDPACWKLVIMEIDMSVLFFNNQ